MGTVILIVVIVAIYCLGKFALSEGLKIERQKKFMKIVKYVRPELKLTGHFRKRDTTWNIQFREGYIVTTDDFRKNGGWFI